MPTHARKSAARPNLVRLEDRTNPVAAFALSGATLVPFDTDFPSLPRDAVAITGLGTGEALVSIDIRPQNGHLYGLTSNGAGAVRLYDISPRNGTATPLSVAPVQFDDGTAAVAIAGTAFGIDFNPTVDRLRIVTNKGVNFRMNPNTGGIVDGNATTAGTNADGSLNIAGAAASGSETAYTNSSAGVSVTTQYTLDVVSQQLFIQNPPNNGTLTGGVNVTSDGTAKLNFTAVGGFDIGSNVTVTASNAAATGTGFAVLTVGGKAGLYTLDLANGKATLLNTVGDGARTFSGLAVAVPQTGTPLVALDGANLLRFNSADAAAVKSIPIAGLTPGEVLVGIDFRPATGQLIGVGINATTDTGSIYLIDPQGSTPTGGTFGTTASLLIAGTAGKVAFVNAAGATIDLPDVAVGYGIDFNPTVDRIRVVTGSGLNFRLNPTTGTGVDGDTVAAGTNPDAGIGGAIGGVDATAYTNSFGGTKFTTQYTLSATADALYIQNPPNNGTQVNTLAITLGGAKLDFGAVNGFEIPAGVQVSASNTAVLRGTGLAALTVGGKSGLYSIDLTTGAATLVNQIGTSATVGGLTAADDLSGRRIDLLAVGTGAGVASSVRVFNPDGTTRFTLAPYEASFTGGVYVATGDINGDGIDDVITGVGNGGGPRVIAFDGITGKSVREFFPYEDTFRGGVLVAAGDLNGDGKADVITGTGVGGGPRVRAFTVATTTVLADFFAYEDTFRGGVIVGSGDINGGGADIIVGTGPGGGPRVIAFDGKTRASISDFLAYDAAFRGGVQVAAYDRDGNGSSDIVAGTGPGVANRVRVVTAANVDVFAVTPFDATFTGGVFVG